jgi:hypothetical protein
MCISRGLGERMGEDGSFKLHIIRDAELVLEETARSFRIISPHPGLCSSTAAVRVTNVKTLANTHSIVCFILQKQSRDGRLRWSINVINSLCQRVHRPASGNVSRGIWGGIVLQHGHVKISIKRDFVSSHEWVPKAPMIRTDCIKRPRRSPEAIPEAGSGPSWFRLRSAELYVAWRSPRAGKGASRGFGEQ